MQNFVELFFFWTIPASNINTWLNLKTVDLWTSKRTLWLCKYLHHCPQPLAIDFYLVLGQCLDFPFDNFFVAFSFFYQELPVGKSFTTLNDGNSHSTSSTVKKLHKFGLRDFPQLSSVILKVGQYGFVGGLAWHGNMLLLDLRITTYHMRSLRCMIGAMIGGLVLFILRVCFILFCCHCCWSAFVFAQKVLVLIKCPFSKILSQNMQCCFQNERVCFLLSNLTVHLPCGGLNLWFEFWSNHPLDLLSAFLLYYHREILCLLETFLLTCNHQC